MSAVPYSDRGNSMSCHFVIMTTKQDVYAAGLLHSNYGISEAQRGIQISLID